MPSTNKKGPINIPPGTDSKNPAKYTSMLNLSNIFKDVDKFKNSLDPKHPSYQGNLPGESKFGVLPGLDAKTIGVTEDDTVTSSGGKGRTEDLPSSLYGTNRFNKLWNLYNDVKGQKDIASNPKYQRLLNKLVRKMPKTLRNLERNVEKTERKRQEMNTKLGFNSTVDSTEEIVSNARDRVETFLNNPTPEYVPKDTNIKNESKDGITGVDIVDQKYSAGEDLGSRLGSDISAALKNKKW